ncbi:hypothetical protein ACIA8K_12835 [Catenuloplanes sp. NPDC051500]|uniref:hypothetical protein n=1 Tax=Catenuloplanes sp. NPDC051500 TaxID=3363959 RepID=UPI0037AB6E08
MNTAHPQDLLVVGWLAEAEDHPQFTEHQVVSAAVVNFVDWVRGRRFRRAYITDGALEHENAEHMIDALLTVAARYGWRDLAAIGDYARVMQADQEIDDQRAAELLAVAA